MNREDRANELAIENVEILRGRLEQADKLLREIRPTIPKDVLELWCADRDTFLASHHSVEANDMGQAEGAQEAREAFESWYVDVELDGDRTLLGSQFERHPEGDYKAQVVEFAWHAFSSGASLAQPSPAPEPLMFACKNLAQITSSDGSGHADIALAVLRMAGLSEDERERLVNEWKAARAWQPVAQAEQMPEWPPCQKSCMPEHGGRRDRQCNCEQARRAIALQVPDALRSAVEWADHLLFECGALVQTRAPSVHVYNQTYAAVEAAKALLAAAPAQGGE